MDEKKITMADLKDTGKKLKKREKLSADELGKVSGGYLEYQGYATGYNVVCPVCGRDDENDFHSWICDSEGLDYFLCRCGYTFAVNANGTIFGSQIYIE